MSYQRIIRSPYETGLRTLDNIWLDIDGERAPYKEMTVTTTDESLLVIAGPDYY